MSRAEAATGQTHRVETIVNLVVADTAHRVETTANREAAEDIVAAVVRGAEVVDTRAVTRVDRQIGFTNRNELTNPNPAS